ncbi:MAG: PAS domain S-box protein [Myxococcaceae bacterium]|nr:PAS domain S-box protein [Myxococcaceae bacterium]
MLEATTTDRLRTLVTAMRAFAEATSDYRVLLETIVRTVAHTFGGYCGVSLLSEDGRSLEPGPGDAPDPAVAAELRERIQVGAAELDARHPLREMLDARHARAFAGDALAAHAARMPLDGAAFVQRVGAVGVLHAPLRAQGQPVGLLTQLRYGPGAAPFSEEDVSLAEGLADHAALAIYNARLIASERAARAAVEVELDRRRRAEQALRKTEELLEAAPDAMVIVGQDGRIQLVNGQVERLFGYERSELLGQSVDLLVPERYRGRHPGHRLGYVAEPRTRPMGEGLDLRAVRKDGTEFAAEISLSPMHDERGMLVTAAIRDVSDRKQLELKMLEASRLKSEFLANMSHELRTPLNAIIGFSELLHKGKAGPLSETQVEYLGDVLASGRHLLQLINDVLDLAKVESGKMDFRPEETDLARVVSEIRDVLRGLFGSKRLQVTTQVEVPTAFVDPARFKQILYNYLSNAIKFTEEGGSIAIRVVPEGRDAFRLDVEDSGIGIPADAFGKLFVEFQQLDASSAKKFQGTGLGLALTKRIAEVHGGRVEVKSTPGLGSTFSAILPRRAASATGRP